MTITKTNLAPQIIKQSKLNAGNIHYFNHIAVVEPSEGVHFDRSVISKVITDLKTYFGEDRPFGIVANKVNSYSVSILDVKDMKSEIPNLASYGIVSYNKAGKLSAKIESSFCERKDICFNNLYEGLDVVYHRVKQRIRLVS